MKKVFLSFAVVALMVSCGGAEQASTEVAPEAAPVEEVAPAADTTAVDSTVAAPATEAPATEAPAK